MVKHVPALNTEEMEALFDALLHLKDGSECYRFFRDICSEAELISIAQRWHVARMLDAGDTYQTISDKLNASTATISRVNHSLMYGEGGYRLLLDRLQNKSAGEESQL